MDSNTAVVPRPNPNLSISVSVSMASQINKMLMKAKQATKLEEEGKDQADALAELQGERESH